MKNITETVQRIERQYVSSDCIQIMVPYKNAITILNQDGILLHSKNGSNVYINKYLNDARRKRFPYSNIPTHYSNVGLYNKMSFANQIFEFEKPYIRICDELITESFVIKDKDQALLINSAMKINKQTKHMTYEELSRFIYENDKEKTYYVYLDGSLPSDNSRMLPTKEIIYSHIQNGLMKNVKDFREYQQEHDDTVATYLKLNPVFLNYVEQSINNLDLSFTDFNVTIGNSTLLILKVNGTDITIQGVEIKFIKQNNYRVDIYDIPVNKYTLEQLKYIPKINCTKEPRIPLRINPGVTKQDIQEAKQMVKALKKR